MLSSALLLGTGHTGSSPRDFTWATGCLTSHRPSGSIEPVISRAAQPRHEAISGSLVSSRQVPIEVPTFVHVLRSRLHGRVRRSRVRSQVDTLNAAFAGQQSRFAAGSPFHFRLVDVDVTVRHAWYRMNQGSLAERNAKRSLHRGSGRALNLYIGNNSAEMLGWASAPTRYAERPLLDGVVIARHTLPGGGTGRFSAGDGAVHETGHWLGLFHTFAGGCSRRGDRVDDTPPEGRPSYECHRHRDTCRATGLDPIHNFMDYGDDACMSQFTPGQVSRMVSAWYTLRDSAVA